MGLFRSSYALVLVIDPLYNKSWTQYINKDLLSRAKYIQHEGIYRIEDIILNDSSNSSTDATIIVCSVGCCLEVFIGTYYEP